MRTLSLSPSVMAQVSVRGRFGFGCLILAFGRFGFSCLIPAFGRFANSTLFQNALVIGKVAGWESASACASEGSSVGMAPRRQGQHIGLCTGRFVSWDGTSSTGTTYQPVQRKVHQLGRHLIDWDSVSACALECSSAGWHLVDWDSILACSPEGSSVGTAPRSQMPW